MFQVVRLPHAFWVSERNCFNSTNHFFLKCIDKHFQQKNTFEMRTFQESLDCIFLLDFFVISLSISLSFSSLLLISFLFCNKGSPFFFIVQESKIQSHNFFCCSLPQIGMFCCLLLIKLTHARKKCLLGHSVQMTIIWQTVFQTSASDPILNWVALNEHVISWLGALRV